MIADRMKLNILFFFFWVKEQRKKICRRQLISLLKYDSQCGILLQLIQLIFWFDWFSWNQIENTLFIEILLMQLKFTITITNSEIKMRVFISTPFFGLNVRIYETHHHSSVSFDEVKAAWHFDVNVTTSPLFLFDSRVFYIPISTWKLHILMNFVGNGIIFHYWKWLNCSKKYVQGIKMFIFLWTKWLRNNAAFLV